MDDHRPDFIEIDGDAIAYRRRAGLSPGVVWLGGYRSDMRGVKAEAIGAWSSEAGRAFLRFDYSGHGESEGDFTAGTISRWLKQSLGVLRDLTDGPQILVASSMGAWIALRLVQDLARTGESARVAGLLLLAPAPDFTSDLVEPGLSDENRRDLRRDGVFEAPSAYGPEPNRYTRALIEDGRDNRVLTGPIDTFCPVHVIQGMQDRDVPYAHALKLVGLLPADDLTLSLVSDGDHRLSRPQDIALILRSLEALLVLAQAPS